MESNLFIGSIVMVIILTIIITVLLIVLGKKSSTFTDGEPKIRAMAIGENLDTDSVIEILYSYNGIVWHKSSGAYFTGLTDYDVSGVAYGNNMWTATGYNYINDVNLIYSEDGKFWANGYRDDGTSAFYNGPSTNNSQRGNNVSYGNNRWVAVGKAGNSENILYSDNGICWFVAGMSGGTNETFKGAENLDGGRAVSYGNNRWVAVGKAENNDGNILYSDNGISWVKSLMLDGTSPFIATPGSNLSAGLGIFYNDNNELWYATGRADNNKNLLISSDGITWVVHDATLNGGVFFNNGCHSIVYSESQNAFIATGNDTGVGKKLAFSKNSITWESVEPFPNGEYPFGNGYITGQYVNYSKELNTWFAAGGANPGISGSAILTSKNGVCWSTTIMSNGISYPYGTKNYNSATKIAVTY